MLIPIQIRLRHNRQLDRYVCWAKSPEYRRTCLTQTNEINGAIYWIAYATLSVSCLRDIFTVFQFELCSELICLVFFLFTTNIRLFLSTYHWQVISCNKNICTLQITDTTGSHQFPAMQRLSITKGHAFILVYSVCSKQSLEELRAIWTLIKELKGQEIAQIPVMLVGNKCDENSLREVAELDGKAEALAWGVSFMETSAKNNINVTELFQASHQLICTSQENCMTNGSPSRGDADHYHISLYRFQT